MTNREPPADSSPALPYPAGTVEKPPPLSGRSSGYLTLSGETRRKRSRKLLGMEVPLAQAARTPRASGRQWPKLASS